MVIFIIIIRWNAIETVSWTSLCMKIINHSQIFLVDDQHPVLEIILLSRFHLRILLCHSSKTNLEVVLCRDWRFDDDSVNLEVMICIWWRFGDESHSGLQSILGLSILHAPLRQGGIHWIHWTLGQGGTQVLTVGSA